MIFIQISSKKSLYCLGLISLSILFYLLMETEEDKIKKKQLKANLQELTPNQKAKLRKHFSKIKNLRGGSQETLLKGLLKVFQILKSRPNVILRAKNFWMA